MKTVTIPCPWSLIYKPNANPNPSKTNHSLASQNSYRRIKAQNIDVLVYRSTILHPHSQVDKLYCQIVWSPFLYPITSHKGGGFSGLKLSQVPRVNCTEPFHSQSFQILRQLYCNWESESLRRKLKSEVRNSPSMVGQDGTGQEFNLNSRSRFPPQSKELVRGPPELVQHFHL